MTPTFLSNGTRVGSLFISGNKTRVLLVILEIFEHRSRDNDRIQWIIRPSSHELVGGVLRYCYNDNGHMEIRG